MEKETLATELLRELTISAKRWFIAFCIMVVLEIATIAGFMWYLSLPVEESVVTVESDDNGNANYVGNDVTGAIYNGKDNSKEDTESKTK